MEIREKTDVNKLVKLFDIDNNFDINNGADMEIQDAIQAKLLQIAKSKAGLPIDKFGYYSQDGNQVTSSGFHDCRVLRSLYDYVRSGKQRIDYLIYWMPAESDYMYYNNTFSMEIADWISFLFENGILDENGECQFEFNELEDAICSIRCDIMGVKDKDAEFKDENRKIANFARQLDFCFSGLSGPITRQASIYLEDLYSFANEMLTIDEIREFHFIFHMIFEYGCDKQLNIVSSMDIAAYYKYCHLIPESDPRKQVAEKAIEIFLDPLCDLVICDCVDANSHVIKHSDEYIVIYTIEEYDYDEINDLTDYFLHPLYNEVLQIIDTLLPELEAEYAEKKLNQAV